MEIQGRFFTNLRVDGEPTERLSKEDEEGLMEFLQLRGKYSHRMGGTYPELIKLDLNMPRMDGRKAPQQIKSDELPPNVPVVVLTASQVEVGINRTYSLGANSFITLSVTFKSFVETLKDFGGYRFEKVSLLTNIEDIQKGSRTE